MKLVFVMLLVCFVPSSLFSQYIFTAFSSLTVSRSALTMGLGNQGVALDGGLSTMQYNPASIASLTQWTLESGKYEAFILDVDYPLTWYRIGFNIDNIGKFGLEFSQIDYGEVYYTTFDNPDGSEHSYHMYERSFALVYGSVVSSEISLGATVRYAYENLPFMEETSEIKESYIHQFLFSGGVLYSPNLFDKKIKIGFSLTDFGASIKYPNFNESDPAPASMRLGVGIDAISNVHQKLTLSFEGSRIVADGDYIGNAKSSFGALFSSFKYWPHDIMGHAGIIYKFMELPISNRITLHQQLSFGIFDQTIYSDYNQMNTALSAGLSIDHFTIDFGVASIWQYISENARTYLFTKSIPLEELELKVAYSPTNADKEIKEPLPLTVSMSFGNLISTGNSNLGYFGNGLRYTLELALNTSSATALVSSISFGNFKNTGLLELFDNGGKYHTYTFTMMYRWDYSEKSFPFYFQAGPSLIRLSYNPSSQYIYVEPRYRYFGGYTLEAGVPISFGHFIIAPCIDFISLLGPVTGSAPRLGGYNQWSYNLKFGVRI